GVTEFDSTGQQVGQGAMNYAVGRHSFEIPPARRDRPITVELFPAFARDGGAHAWRARVRVRFLLRDARPLGDGSDGSVVAGGPIDYLMMDYLAEVTMSIMQKQKSRDPSLGYATDFVPLMERILPTLAERGIKVTANAGGVNPRACAEAVAAAARALGLAGKLKIGILTGDDLLGRLDGLLARGHQLRNLDTGRPLRDVRDRVQSANAYLGAGPVGEALRRNADIVITGRVTDTGLTLAPLIHAFDWKADAWDLVAAGSLAVHPNGAGAQWRW